MSGTVVFEYRGHRITTRKGQYVLHAWTSLVGFYPTLAAATAAVDASLQPFSSKDSP